MQFGQRFRTFSPPVTLIWRFYSDAAHMWRWQRLAIDGTVVGHSKGAYPQYESCVRNAGEHGYAFVPSTTSKTEKNKPRVKRSYIPITVTRHRLVSELIPDEAEQKDDDLPLGRAPGNSYNEDLAVQETL